MWIEEEISIGKIDEMLKNGCEVEVTSPDGFVPVSLFVDKGEWDEYILTLDSGIFVSVNENHLFETENGWQYARDLINKHDEFYLTDVGYYVHGNVVKTGNRIPIVDIQVDHDNHRYYTNGVSSHNTGVGKSLFMCHVAAACMAQGKNVLYITMEMAEERIAERIDANLLNVSMDELMELSEDSYVKKVNRVRSNTIGKLLIKEYPTASASATHFRTLLNELNLKRNFVPDIIFVDYLNICCSSRLKVGSNVNSYTYVKAIAEELRGLAVEYDLPLVTATQTTRSGFNSSDPGMEDVSESFGLPATADMMFALISSEELEQLNQIMVKQLKNRYSDLTHHKRFTIGIDRAKMKLYDIEQSAQTGIVDAGHGHEFSPSKQKKNFEGFKV